MGPHAPGVRRIRQLQPVELHFTAWRMRDHRRRAAAPRRVTRLAVRPHLVAPQGTGERRMDRKTIRRYLTTNLDEIRASARERRPKGAGVCLSQQGASCPHRRADSPITRAWR